MSDGRWMTDFGSSPHKTNFRVVFGALRDLLAGEKDGPIDPLLVMVMTSYEYETMSFGASTKQSKTCLFNDVTAQGN